MKLLVQSDDYAISPAVAQGVLHGIQNGIIRNTGLFANMPWTEQCVEWIKPYLDKIAFGVDLNITTGGSVLPWEQIPSIVKEGNIFFTSRESRIMDQTVSGEHVVYDQVLAEFDAQIRKYIQLTGKKPDYLHGHAYTTPLITQAHRELADSYGIPYSFDVWKRLTGDDAFEYHVEWYKRPATLDNQAGSSLKNYILIHKEEWMKEKTVILVGHMGYVDRELMDLSSYTLYRPNDLAGVTDPEVIHWVRENSVELITYRDV